MTMFTPNQIRELRKSLGMTAAELGKELGVAECTVCHWERGLRHPGWKNLVKLNEFAEKSGAAVSA